MTGVLEEQRECSRAANRAELGVVTGVLLVLVVTCHWASQGAIPRNHVFAVRLPPHA